MLGVSLNVIMHHQACLLLPSSLLRTDKSSAPFNPLTGAHAHTLLQRLNCQPHHHHSFTHKQTTRNFHICKWQKIISATLFEKEVHIFSFCNKTKCSRPIFHLECNYKTVHYISHICSLQRTILKSHSPPCRSLMKPSRQSVCTELGLALSDYPAMHSISAEWASVWPEGGGDLDSVCH